MNKSNAFYNATKEYFYDEIPININMIV